MKIWKQEYIFDLEALLLFNSWKVMSESFNKDRTIENSMYIKEFIQDLCLNKKIKIWSHHWEPQRLLSWMEFEKFFFSKNKSFDSFQLNYRNQSIENKG